MYKNSKLSPRHVVLSQRARNIADMEEFEGGAAMVGVAALELGESENIKALRDGFR